jgi:DNA transformation protein and related proteins
MAVTAAFRAFALESLGRVAPVTARSMFGGVGIYSEGVFFALIDDNAVYLKVDDSTRGDFEAVGMGPFRPYGEKGSAMAYYELRADLLEDAERLRPWVEKAVEVGRRKRRK